jgi:hypothetical protein
MSLQWTTLRRLWAMIRRNWLRYLKRATGRHRTRIIPGQRCCTWADSPRGENTQNNQSWINQAPEYFGYRLTDCGAIFKMHAGGSNTRRMGPVHSLGNSRFCGGTMWELPLMFGNFHRKFSILIVCGWTGGTNVSKHKGVETEWETMGVIGACKFYTFHVQMLLPTDRLCWCMCLSIHMTLRLVIALSPFFSDLTDPIVNECINHTCKHKRLRVFLQLMAHLQTTPLTTAMPAVSAQWPTPRSTSTIRFQPRSRRTPSRLLQICTSVTW